ncbi:MAG: hypothetical protein OEU33_13815, partial [Chromatiales bacterium]|nr:hypothetical protein [Chromatiales bacterium]
MIGTAAAEPDIDPGQLDFEAYGNGRETGVTADPTAAMGTAPWAPQVQKSFLGVNFDDNAEENDGFRFIPPDPIGAVGHSRVISVVNTMIESRNKGGEMKWRSSLAEFFAPLEPKTFTFDPKIVYDQYEDRFVVVTLERVQGTGSAGPDNESRIMLAVSKDGNPQTPTGADWYYLSVDAKQTVFGSFDGWADYPGFEVDEEAVYVTANIFTFNPFGFYGGVRVWIVPKTGFYDGGVATANAYDPAGESGFIATTMQPAQIYGDGGVGGPGSSIGTYLVAYSGLTFGGPTGDEAIQVITIDDPLGANGGPFFSGQFVILGDIENVGGPCGFPALADAPQAGTDALIEVNDRRALDAVWREGQLYTTATIDPEGACSPDPALAGTTKAYWVRMDATGGPGTIFLADSGIIDGEDIAPDTTTFFPAIGVNRLNEMVVGFSASAPTIYAGAFAAGRGIADGAGMIGPTQTVKAGEDYYLRTFG